MENKETCYTYQTNTTGTGYTTNKTVDSNINLNNGCPYLLPCGICEKTNRQCPKHWQYESPFIWNEWTCGTDISDSNTVVSDDILKYTTKSENTTTCNYTTDINKKF